MEGDPQICQKGANVVMDCLITSAAEPTTKWFRVDKDLPADEKKFKVGVDKAGDKYRVYCEILQFDKPLADVYKCEISNSEGKTTATFTVQAGDAPEFTEKPKIIQKDNGKVLCVKMKGKKATKVEWFKEDKPIKETDRVKPKEAKDDKTGETTYTMEISMPEKADEGKYVLKLSNAEGSNSQSLNLAFD